MYRFLTLIVATLFMSQAVWAKDEAPWHNALKNQLMRQEQCQLKFLSGVKHFDQAKHRSVEARAHCVDGRAFDINNRNTLDKFEVHACGPVSC